MIFPGKPSPKLSSAASTPLSTNGVPRNSAAGNATTTKAPIEAPFTLDQLRDFLTSARGQINIESVRTELDKILTNLETHYAQLESLEQILTALEDKMIATARAALSETDLIEARRQLDSQLKMYRGKMTGPQLLMLKKQYLDRWLLEHQNLPRLSLFYVL